MKDRDKERQTDKDRETDRDTETQTKTEKQTQTERQTQRELASCADLHEPLFEAVVMSRGHVPFAQTGLDERAGVLPVRVVADPAVPPDGHALCRQAVQGQ